MKKALLGIAALLVTFPALAQSPSLEVDQLECLPQEANQIVTATVKGLAGGDRVRVNFRRVNPEGAFYYLDMASTGGDKYWAALPKPEDREQQEISDEWWADSLSSRDWVDGLEREEIQDLFDELENEAAEYYVTVHDAGGEQRERSDALMVEVKDPSECEVELAPVEQGYARNLTVGETTELQMGKTVFHWLCDGIVTREGWQGILRPDEFCRACVVAWWEPATALGAIGAAIALQDREPRRVSPETPQ